MNIAYVSYFKTCQISKAEFITTVPVSITTALSSQIKDSGNVLWSFVFQALGLASLTCDLWGERSSDLNSWLPGFADAHGANPTAVAQSCPTLCDPMNRGTPGLPVHHQLPESTQTHVHGVGDAIQPSHPLSSPSPPALNPSQHQDLFKWVSSSHQVATRAICEGNFLRIWTPGSRLCRRPWSYCKCRQSPEIKGLAAHRHREPVRQKTPEWQLNKL